MATSAKPIRIYRLPKNVIVPVLDPPKMDYFWRIWHTPCSIFEELEHVKLDKRIYISICNTWRWRRGPIWRRPWCSRDPIWRITITNKTFVQEDLARDGASTFHLSFLNSIFHTISTISGANIPFTLPHGINRLIACRVEAIATSHAIFQCGKSSISSFLKPTTW